MRRSNTSNVRPSKKKTDDPRPYSEEWVDQQIRAAHARGRKLLLTDPDVACYLENRALAWHDHGRMHEEVSELAERIRLRAARHKTGSGYGRPCCEQIATILDLLVSLTDSAIERVERDADENDHGR